MTDWGPEVPYAGDDLKGMDMEADLSAWYWVLHPDSNFNGEVGILHFTNGRAAYSPEYMHERGKTNWFRDDGQGGVEANPDVQKPALWILPWCWRENGFTIVPMNGGRAEYDELVPVESTPNEFTPPAGSESALIMDPEILVGTDDEAGEEIAGEEEVTSDG